MTKKKDTKKLIDDPQLYERMKAHLYSKQPLLGEDSPFSELLQQMVDKMLEGEMDVFLGEERQEGKANKRNGKIPKQVLSTSGPLYINTPRDRNGDFEPALVGKRQRELSSGLDDQIIALYAQGNSIEDVRRLMAKIYGVHISAGKISQITDKVLPVIQEWQDRPLKAFYPIVYLDAVHFKVRFEGRYDTRAFYTVYAVDWEGQRDLLGMYIQSGEGASRWGMVLQDLSRRGVQDILVICTDNLKGFSEVISEVFPDSIVQKCIVHQVRNSLRYVDEKDRKKVAADLRKVYTSPAREQAQLALEAFAVTWGKTYGYIMKQWQENWDELIAFMDFPKEMRRMIYTTNPVEALHRIIRKMVKGKAAWVSDTALMKQLYLTLMHNEKSWRRRAYGWISIQRDLLELYPNRIEKWIKGA
ncbi:MAG TPA: IS256 family transposase [Desulfobacterales bacterium]|nr:IS256 family transposase [Desulfobacterales bacterium]